MYDLMVYLFKKIIYLFDNMKNFEATQDHIAFCRSHWSCDGNLPDCCLEPESRIFAQLGN